MASPKGRSRRHAHKEKKREDHGFTPYMAHKICEVCRKQCYASHREARRSARINHPGRVMHVYWCEEPSGRRWFHLSSIPAGRLTRLREKERAQGTGLTGGAENG